MALSFLGFKPEIVNSVDRKDSCGALVSIQRHGRGGNVEVVVGAKYEDRCRCYFNKRSLQKLIDSLQEVQEVME